MTYSGTLLLLMMMCCHWDGAGRDVVQVLNVTLWLVSGEELVFKQISRQTFQDWMTVKAGGLSQLLYALVTFYSIFLPVKLKHHV